MRVSVVFRNTPVLVPVGEGRMKISDLIEMAITRYKKTDSRLAEFTITVRSLRLLEGGSFVDLDDEVADVLDDKEVVLADFDLIGDSLSTSSQESGPLLPTSASYSGRVKRAHSSQPEAASNLLSVPSSSNPSLADHDDSISSDMSPWTPSASLVTENDIPDVLWRQGHRETASTNSLTRANRSSSFASSQSERFTPSEPSAREMAVDGPLQSNHSSFAESLSEARLRVPSLSDARTRNSYAGPGIYERERLYDDHHYPPRRFRNKPYHPMDGPSPQDYMRYRYRNQRLEGYNQRFQERPGHGMFLRHGSASNIMQQQRAPAEDGSGGYQGRYEEPVDYFLSQPLYFHEHRATNEPSGYALSQPAHTFRSVRPSVVHAADLDPNSEAPHLRHLSQDDHSSRSDTPTYRSSPVPEGMRLDAATYHGNRVLRFSDNEDEDNYVDQVREEQISKQQAMSRYVPFQRNKRFSIQRDGLVFARWAEYCENSGIPESDEDKDDESVRHMGGYSPNSSREELSYHGNSHRGGRTTSPPVDQDSSGRGQGNGRGQVSNHIQSATESESEDDLGNIHIIELHKGSHELGIRIKKCSADNKDIGIFVDAIETEGFAAVSHKLQINDRILACNGCDFTKLSNHKAENMFKEMMDEPLLRMAISRGNQYASGEGSDVSDYHHGDGDSTVDGSDPGYSFTNTREIGVIHDIKIMKGGHGLGFGVTTRDIHVNTKTAGSQPIYIKNIAKDGPAFRDGRLKLGDRLLKVNGVSVEQMSQSQVVQLMRSLPQGIVTLQVSRQETRPSNNDDSISVLEVPASDHNNEATSGNIGAGGSGRMVMTFDIVMHQSDTASLGVTVHGRTRQNSPSHSSKNADIGIYIKSIVPGGLAAMDGRVQPSDQVLCVNGHNLLDRSNSEAMAVLKSALAQIKPGTSSIQLVISRKTSSVPLKSPAAIAAVISDDNSQQQINEVGIDVGNAAMATPNSQSSQSSAGVVRIESTENLLTQRRRNESEPLSKYSLERIGSHDQLGRQATRSKTTVGKSPVKRSSSESHYDNQHLQSGYMSPTSHNSSSSGSGLISPTGVTLSLSGSHDSNSLMAGRQINRPGDRHSNYTADMLSSSTPVHREYLPSRSHGDYPSHSLPRPSTQRKRAGSPSPRLESSGSTGELGGAYFRRDAPERISIKKSKQAPQRDFSQFNFRNSEPKIEGDDSSSIDMMRTGSAESILANRSPVHYKIPLGPHLGLAKSSSLESLQTILAAQRLSEASDELGMRSREARSSFRKAVDKSYSKPEDPSDEVTDHGLLDPSLMSYTKNPKNKVKRRGFLKNLFRKGKHKRFSSLAMDDQHGDIAESPSSQIDFDPTPPARVELRPHHHDNTSTSSNSSSKLYQRYSMSVIDDMEFEDDDITATIADV